MSDFERLLDSKAFEAIEPERKAFLVELHNKLEGKNSMEAMAVLMRAKPPEGRDFSPEETELMIEAMLSSMEPEERQRMRFVIEKIKDIKG